jgi:hypothetical protein
LVSEIDSLAGPKVGCCVGATTGGMLSPRSVVLTKLFEEPDKSDKRSVAASATIFDTGLPASKYKAATPAT